MFRAVIFMLGTTSRGIEAGSLFLDSGGFKCVQCGFDLNGGFWVCQVIVRDNGRE